MHQIPECYDAVTSLIATSFIAKVANLPLVVSLAGWPVSYRVAASPAVIA